MGRVTRETSAGGLPTVPTGLTSVASLEALRNRPTPTTSAPLDQAAARLRTLLHDSQPQQTTPTALKTELKPDALQQSAALPLPQTLEQRTGKPAPAARTTDHSSHVTQSTDTEPTASQQPNTAVLSGDRILQSLSHANTVVEQPLTTAKSTAQTSDRIEQIERLGERLAQRILVSDRNQIGNTEVRIQLHDSVLQGSEIRLRHEHGQLVVSIQIPNLDLARSISSQTDGLQQTLAQRLETSVRVEVQVVSTQAAGRDAGNDASPGDGRSRNRHDLWFSDVDQGP